MAIGKGLSRRERTFWLSLIVILLASLSGLTYYFIRQVNELAAGLSLRPPQIESWNGQMP